MKILSIKRTDRFVEYKHEVQGHKAMDEVKVICKEAPLKEFDEALQALKKVIAGTKNLPANWLKAATVTKLTIKYAKAGTRTCQVFFERYYSVNEKNMAEKTPQFRIEDAESGRRQCSEQEAELIATMIHEAERYVNEEREQFLLGLDDDPPVPAQPDDGTQMSFEEMTEQYKDRPPVVHKGTDTPDYSSMPLGQCLYLIESEEKIEYLKEDLKKNFGCHLAPGVSIDALKDKLKELVTALKGGE